MVLATSLKQKPAASGRIATRTYLATLADGAIARCTVLQGYHPELGGGEIARVRSQFTLAIVDLEIIA